MNSIYETKIHTIQTDGRPGSWLKKRIDLKLINRILKCIQPLRANASIIHVLEVGTGSGRIAELLLDADTTITYCGVEPVRTLREATIETMSRFAERSEIVDDSLPELHGIPSCQFDVCMMFHLLEHASDHLHAHEWLKSIYLKIKPGGYVMILCPNIFDYKPYFYDADWSHGYPTTTNRIRDLGVDIGFEVVEALDLRCNSANVFVKTILACVSKLIPTGVVNKFGYLFFNIAYIGMGLQASMFWRNSWVVLKRDE